MLQGSTIGTRGLELERMLSQYDGGLRPAVDEEKLCIDRFHNNTISIAFGI